MFQHRLHDAVGTFAVLGDLLQVAGQQCRDVVDLRALICRSARLRRRDRFLQFPQQIDGQFREVVDEVERVLDLVRDAGGELAERGHLLRLDQIGLGGFQFADSARLSAASRAARISASLRLRSVMSA